MLLRRFLCASIFGVSTTFEWSWDPSLSGPRFGLRVKKLSEMPTSTTTQEGNGQGILRSGSEPEGYSLPRT